MQGASSWIRYICYSSWQGLAKHVHTHAANNSVTALIISLGLRIVFSIMSVDVNSVVQLRSSYI